MAYTESTAITLIGAARTADFQCNHVVNQVLTGNKYGRLAVNYLTWGKKIDKPVAGAVVVGLDGKHVGIFVSDDEFIHSSSSKMQVVKVSSAKLQYVFPNGWEFRVEN